MTAFFKLEGPDRYCPHCKRRLVEVHPDGTFDLAAQAAIEGSQTITWSDGEAESVDFTYEAQCLRTRCRIKSIIGSAIRS